MKCSPCQQDPYQAQRDTFGYQLAWVSRICLCVRADCVNRGEVPVQDAAQGHAGDPGRPAGLSSPHPLLTHTRALYPKPCCLSKPWLFTQANRTKPWLFTQAHLTKALLSVQTLALYPSQSDQTLAIYPGQSDQTLALHPNPGSFFTQTLALHPSPC